MSIVFDNATVAVGEYAGDGTLTWNHTTTTEQNCVLVVFIAHGRSSGNPFTTSTLTYNSVSMTANQICNIEDTGTGVLRLEAFYLVNPSTGSNTINAVLSGSPEYEHTAAAMTVYGVNTSNPISLADVQSGSYGNGVHTLSETVTNVLSSDLLFDTFFTAGSADTHNPGANQIERFHDRETGCTLAGSTQLGTDGAVMSYGVDNDFGACYVAGRFISALPKVKCRLVQRDGTIHQNLTNIKWAWFDETDPQNFNAPTNTGTVETTDVDGFIEVNIPGTSLVAGQLGCLALSTSDNVDLGLYKLRVY